MSAPRRPRHRLSRLARHALVPWLVRFLAVFLLFSNTAAFALPLSPAMGKTVQAASMTMMHGAHAMHSHAATADCDANSKATTHGERCPCCQAGHCDCLYPGSSGAVDALGLSIAWVFSPIEARAAPSASVTPLAFAPPLRPPIA